MAKLTKRADGRYHMNLYLGVDENGKKIRRSIYGRTQKEVLQKAEELRVRLGKGIDINAERDSFSIWCDRWLVMKKSSVDAAQYDLCKARVEIIRQSIGKIKLVDVTTADLQQIINELASCNPFTGKPSAKKTLGDYKQIMTGIYKTAIQSRAIDYNPAEYVKIPQYAPCEERRAITDIEREWIESTPHRAQTAAMIMLYAGLRRGEVSALTWNDVDLKAGTITVNKSVTYKGDNPRSVKDPKTEAGERVIPIPKKLKDYLSALPKTSLLVVTSARGTQLTESAWKRMWESYMKVLNEKHANPSGRSRFSPDKGGLPMMIRPFTPHCLRHTYCTMLYEAGVDVLVAKQLMGHSDVKTTLGIYTHLSRKHMSTNAALLDVYLGDIEDETSDNNL